MFTDLRPTYVLPIGHNRITRSYIAMVLLALSLLSHHALAAEPELLVAIQSDIPPYVIQQATKGLHVDLVRGALSDYTLRFIQMPKDEVQTAVQQKRADVSVNVQSAEDGVFYSNDSISFANYAISKKADGLKISRVADLENHQVLAWQRAYLELGDEFKQLFSTQSPQRKNYIEVANQIDQVRMFWHGKNKIIVIDGSIFRYFSKELGYSVNDVEFHEILPAVTNLKVGFKEAAVRDKFNQRLAEICQSGDYAKLLKRYDVELENTICDEPAVKDSSSH